MISETDLPRNTLLALCAGAGPSVDQGVLETLSQDQWEWIHNRARQYRLLPMLHSIIAQQPDWPVPAELREAALGSHRSWVFRSLIMQQALIEIGELLDTHSIPYAALKGASLSLEFYAEPALRPMRDLDIMVLPDDAERAYDKLKAAGFQKVQGKGEYGLEYKHHLPPLRNAQGVYLELHHRIAPCDWSGSQPLGNRLVENARPVEFQGHTIRMAHPTDTYLHLVVHAAFHNLFDNGPNLLSDVAALEQTRLIDRDKVAAFANAHGLAQSVALVDALVARFGGGEGGAVPAKMIEQAADLMTQDPDEHWQRFLLRKRRDPVGRILGGVRRAFRPNAFDLSEIAGKDVSGLEAIRHYPAWIYERAKVYLGAELKSGLDKEAAGDAELEAWLERPALTERDVKA